MFKLKRNKRKKNRFACLSEKTEHFSLNQLCWTTKLRFIFYFKTPRSDFGCNLGMLLLLLNSEV